MERRTPQEAKGEGWSRERETERRGSRKIDRPIEVTGPQGPLELCVQSRRTEAERQRLGHAIQRELGLSLIHI